MLTTTSTDRGRLQVVPSDREVKATIVSRLRENPYTQDCRIKVAVHDGVVRLAGRVDSPDAGYAAIDDASVVPGVADVVTDGLVLAA